MERRTHRGWRRALAATAALAVVGGVTLASQPEAMAFKPYTHIQTGIDARGDVIADGMVSIAGTEYTVDQRIVDALDAWPSYYNSGVIGPDGYPDLIMGQSIIHPENTGLWLRHILDSAWAAQNDNSYSADEKGQILAFAYGYLTHASGDLWMHTMVNQFADGTFPAVKEILTDVEDASIALRHLVVEGYVGDATRFFDGNSERSQLPDGDFSADSTPGVAFDVPTRFVYETLVRKVDGNGDAVGPAQDRGALLDYFFDKRAELQAHIDNTPDPIAAAVAEYNETKAEFEALSAPAHCTPEDAQVDDDGDGAPDDGCGDDNDPDAVGEGEDESGDCSFGAGNTGIDIATDIAWDAVACPAALVWAGISGTVEAFTALVTTTLDVLLDAIVDLYLEEWVKDIDAGLKAWPEFGLALTKGFFDPQTKRDLANAECDELGSDTAADDTTRSICEDGFGTVDAVLGASQQFIDEHLLSMLGLPDFIGDLHATLSEFSEAVSDAIGPALNPLRDGIQAIKNLAVEFAKDEISERLGIDVDQVIDYIDSPSSKMDVGGFDITLPVVGQVTARLFRNQEWIDTHPGEPDQETDHAKLDRYLHLPADHHAADSGLKATAEFSELNYAAYYNTVQLNKLLLLGGSELDRLMGNLTGGNYSFYAGKPQANIMLTPMPEDRDGDGRVDVNEDANGNGWLDPGEDADSDGRLDVAQDVNGNGVLDAGEDADADGVLDPGEDAPDGALDAGPSLQEWLVLIDGDHGWRSNANPVFVGQASGGLGNMPMWESCVLRPAFRDVFRDWENDTNLDGVIDRPSVDTDHDGWQDAGEQFPDLGDAPSYDPNDPTPPVSSVALTGGKTYTNAGTTYINGATGLSVELTDAYWPTSRLQAQVRVLNSSNTVVVGPAWLGDGGSVSLAGLPDGTYRIETSGKDACARETPHVTTVVLDTTPPVITITTPPDSATYDTDDQPLTSYSATDALSGVKSLTSQFDGSSWANGSMLDMFYLSPGLHSLVVTASDNVDNSTTRTSTFRVRATAQSLVNNVTRARSLGLIPDTKTYNGLRDKVTTALAAHKRGQHATEWNKLEAFVQLLEAQRGQGIDAATANRFIAFAQDLISAGG